MAKFKILSIDGGGIRGIIPCKILEVIESQVGPLHETFDLMAGTSTGGIIAMGLSAPNPFSTEELLDLYTKHGNKIFDKRKEDFWSWLSSYTNLKEVMQYYYNAEGLEALLHDRLKDSKLSESVTELLITTFDIQRNKPFYYLSRLAKDKENSTEDAMLRDIARATSAAPTYFTPKVQYQNTNNELTLVDGGVIANNPSILAYCEAKELWKRRNTFTFEPESLSSDEDLPFFMLSIGTGNIKQSITFDEAKNYRTKDWIEPLLTILMDGASSNTDYSMHYLLPKYKNGEERYIRINIDVPIENSRMDDTSPQNIDNLCKLADDYLNSEAGKMLLGKICNLLLKR